MNIKEIISLYNLDIIIEHFNKNYVNFIKENLKNENIKILIEDINTVTELYTIKIKQHININNISKLNILDIETVEINFLNKIINELKKIQNTKYSVYEDFYTDIKNINLLIDIYFNFNSILRNILVLNNKYYISNILSDKYKETLEELIRTNKLLSKKNKTFIQKAFYKINGYKNHFPILFFLLLELLLHIKKDVNIINIYLEKNMFKFLQEILNNPFLYNLSNEKKFFLIVIYYEIFFKFFINNNHLLETYNISFLINNLKIMLKNFYDISEYIIKDINNIIMYKNNFYKYNYLSFYEKQLLINEFNQYFKELNVEKNKTFYVEELKIILTKINNYILENKNKENLLKKLVEERNNLTLKLMILTINYVHNFYSRLINLLKKHVMSNKKLNDDAKKEILDDFNKNKYEYYIYSEINNLYKYRKNSNKIYEVFSTINYYFWKLYKLSIIEKKYNTFKIIKNNILYYIKIYSINKVKEEIAKFKKEFYLSDIEALEYLLKDNVKTEELLEIIDEKIILDKILDENINFELNTFIILLLENFEKKDSKLFKELLNKIIEKKWYKDEKINEYLKKLGIYIYQNPIEVENIKIFD